MSSPLQQRQSTQQNPHLRAVDAAEAEFYHEQQLLHQQQLTAWQHPTPPQPPTTDLNLPDDDETFLDRLSVMLANRAGQFLSEPETLQQILNFGELQRDNRQLAKHIQHLLTVINEQKKALQSKSTQEQLAIEAQYKHVIGSLYVKR